MKTRLLVCAATADELRTFLRDDETLPAAAEDGYAISGALAMAVTGVGMPCTLLRLPPLLASFQPDLVLNIGIAGAYPNSGLAVGDIAVARSETVGDIGFELPDEPSFRHVSSAPFGRFYRKLPLTPVPEQGWRPAGYHIVVTDGCTVNMCTGTSRTGLMRERLHDVGMESMEGAAVALACDAAGIRASEVRAISNIAADRSMLPENIRLALNHLREFLQEYRGREGV